jgi:hypothetical protein
MGLEVVIEGRFMGEPIYLLLSFFLGLTGPRCAARTLNRHPSLAATKGSLGHAVPREANPAVFMSTMLSA